MSTHPDTTTSRPDAPLQVQPDPLAFITQLSPQASWVFNEYLMSEFLFDEVLENKLATLGQSILDELALYMDIRTRDGHPELYLKKEQ